MKKLHVKIKGMHCQSCTTLIKDALTDAGIAYAKVSVGSAVIEYDEKKIKEGDIKAMIKKEGYEVE